MSGLDQLWYESFVLEVLVKTTLVITLALATSTLCRGFSAAWRHWIYTIGFLACLTLPLLAAILPMLPIVIESRLVAPTFAQTSFIPTPSPEVTGVEFWPLLLLIYIVGVAWKLTQLLTAALQLRNLRANAQTASHKLQQTLNELKMTLGVRRPVSLLVSDKFISPLTYGCLKPVILLPDTWQSWDPEVLKGSLVHELAHIRRLDWLTLLIANTISAFHWFNPIFRLAFQQLERECERSCDDAALSLGIRPSTYAKQLLTLANQQLNLQPASLAMIGKPPLADRVHAILNPTERRDTMNQLRLLIISACATALLIPLAACQTVSAQSEALQIANRDQPPAVYDDQDDQMVVPSSEGQAPVVHQNQIVEPSENVVAPLAPVPALAPVPVVPHESARAPSAISAPRAPNAISAPRADLVVAPERHLQHELHAHELALQKKEEALQKQMHTLRQQTEQLERQRQVMEQQHQEFERARELMEQERGEQEKTQLRQEEMQRAFEVSLSEMERAQVDRERALAANEQAMRQKEIDRERAYQEALAAREKAMSSQ